MILIKRLSKLDRQIISILLISRSFFRFKKSNKTLKNFLIKKVLKNVINLTHDNFNMQKGAIKGKCKQIIRKSLNPKTCILFQ